MTVEIEVGSTNVYADLAIQTPQKCIARLLLRQKSLGQSKPAA